MFVSFSQDIPAIIVTNKAFLAVRLLLIVAIVYFDYLHEQNRSLNDWILSKPIYYRWVAYMILLLIFFSFGNFGKSDFIYAGF